MRRTFVAFLALPLVFAGCLAAASVDGEHLPSTTADDVDREIPESMAASSAPEETPAPEAPRSVFFFERRYTRADVDATGWTQVRFRAEEVSNLTLRSRGTHKSEGSPGDFSFKVIRESKGTFGGSGGGMRSSFALFNVDERVGGHDVRLGCCPADGTGGGKRDGRTVLDLDRGEIVSFVVVTRNVTELDFKFRLEGNGTLALLSEERGAGNRYSEIPHPAYGNSTFVSGLNGERIVLRSGPVRHVIEAPGPGIFTLIAAGYRDGSSFQYGLELPNGTRLEETINPGDAAYALGQIVEGGQFVLTFTPGKKDDSWRVAPLNFEYIPLEVATPSFIHEAYRYENW